MSETNPDETALKKQYVETGDIKFAARAIGRFPDDPPPWAILACCKEYIGSISSAKSGLKKEDGGAVLDEMIRIYFEFEDRAEALAISQNRPFKANEHQPPDENYVLDLALYAVEGIEKGHRRFRARRIAVERQLQVERSSLEKQMENERAELQQQRRPGQVPLQPTSLRAACGALRTPRYDRLVKEWVSDALGEPTHTRSLINYLTRLAGSSSATTQHNFLQNCTAICDP